MDVKLFGLTIDKDGVVRAMKDVTESGVNMAKEGAKNAQLYADAYREKMNRVAREYIPATMAALDNLSARETAVAKASRAAAGDITSLGDSLRVQTVDLRNAERAYAAYTAEQSMATVATEKATEAAGGAVAGMGRIRQGLTSLAAHLTGTIPVLDRLGSTLLTMGAGGEVALAVIGGVVAIAAAYRYLTSETRKLAEEHDKELKALHDWNEEAMRGPGGKFAGSVDAGEKELALKRARMVALAADIARPVSTGGGAAQSDIDDMRVAEAVGRRLRERKEYDALAVEVRNGEARLADIRKTASTAATNQTTRDLAAVITAGSATAAQIRNAEAMVTGLNQTIRSLRGNGSRIGDMTDAIAQRDMLNGALHPDIKPDRAGEHLEEEQFRQRIAQRLAEWNHFAKEQRDEYKKTSEETVKDFEREQDEETAIALREANERAKNEQRTYKETTDEALREFERIQKYHDDMQQRWNKGWEQITGRGLTSFRRFFEAVGELGDSLRKRMEQEGDTNSTKYRVISYASAAIDGGLSGFSSGESAYSASRSDRGNRLAGGMAGAAHGAAVGSSIAGPIGGVIGSITGFVAGVFGAGHAAAEAEKQFRELQKAVTLSMDTLRAAVNHDILGAGISQVNADREQRRKAIEEAYQGGGADSDTVRKRNAALAEMNALEDKRIEQLRKEYAQQQQYDKQDLTVRRLRAEGKLYEADALAFAEAQQREYQDAVNAGRDATYLATLQATQYAEAIAHTANVMQAAVRNAPSGFKVSGYTYDFSSAAPGPSSTSASPSSVTFDLRGTTFEIKGGTGPQMITDFANALRQKANATLGANVPLSTALDRLA